MHKENISKNWLQLHIEDSSSDDNEKNQQITTENKNNKEANGNNVQKQKLQQYNGNLTNPKRDAFSATKVSRGFFMDGDDNYNEEYDNFEVKEIKMKKNDNQPMISMQNVKEKNVEIKEIIQQDTPMKSSSEKQDYINEKQSIVKEQPFMKKKSKMFQLNLSDSEQSDLPNSQEQARFRDHDELEQWDNNDDEENKRKGKQRQQQQDNEQQQQSQVNQYIDQQINPDIIEQNQYYNNNFKRLKNYEFNKQPQYQVLDQINEDERLRAIITRNTQGLNILWPQFQVKLESNGLNLLLIKKQSFTLGSSYKIHSKLITTQKKYFGRIQSNLGRDFYKIHISDNGSTDSLKAEIYFTNVNTGNILPRQFTVYMLCVECKFEELVGSEVKHEMSLKEYFEFSQNKNKIKMFTTRKTSYDQKESKYVLDFHNRIGRSSIKNFILQDSQTQEEVLMFGRLNKDNFKLEISHPLNCVIGTAIVMVEFQGRFME